jgi:hypothetical protein
MEYMIHANGIAVRDLLAQILFGLMVQVVLAVILLHLIPQHEKVLEAANATHIGPFDSSASPNIVFPFITNSWPT